MPTQPIAQWRRWCIYISEDSNGKIATKVAKHASTRAAIQKESKILRYLNRHDVDFVPQVIEVEDDRFSYYWIEWSPMKHVRKTLSDSQKNTVARALLDKAYHLDCLGVVHGELSRPTTNVLLNATLDVSIVDFDRGVLHDDSWKNMRHVAQRLCQKWYMTIPQARSLQWMERDKIYSYISHLIPSTAQPAWNMYTYILIGIWVLCDLGSKYLFYDLQRWSTYLLLTPAFNTWIWWSLPVSRWIVIPVTFFIIMLLRYRGKAYKEYKRVLVLFIAWAIWNAYDRILLGWVRDFIDLQYRPIFNLADIYISCWLVLFLAYEFKLLTTISTFTKN